MMSFVLVYGGWALLFLFIGIARVAKKKEEKHIDRFVNEHKKDILDAWRKKNKQ